MFKLISILIIGLLFSGVTCENFTQKDSDSCDKTNLVDSGWFWASLFFGATTFMFLVASGVLFVLYWKRRGYTAIN